MSYATEHIASTLKAARERKGLSQRALSQVAGVPQGHISKIENDAVDLRISSLVALARALDLELTLVPRKTLPAVQSVVRAGETAAGSRGESTREVRKELERFQKAFASHLKSGPAPEELTQLQRQLRELERFGASDADAFRAANKALRAFLENQDLDIVRHSLSQVKNLRNMLAHSHPPETESVRPAYSLEEDDHG